MGKFNAKITATFDPPRKWIMRKDLIYTCTDLTYSVEVSSLYYPLTSSSPSGILRFTSSFNHSDRSIHFASTRMLSPS